MNEMSNNRSEVNQVTVADNLDEIRQNVYKIEEFDLNAKESDTPVKLEISKDYVSKFSKEDFVAVKIDDKIYYRYKKPELLGGLISFVIATNNELYGNIAFVVEDVFEAIQNLKGRFVENNQRNTIDQVKEFFKGECIACNGKGSIVHHQPIIDREIKQVS